MIWRDSIVLALEGLSNQNDGLGYPLVDIYKAVATVRTDIEGHDSWQSPTWQNSIKENLEHYCPTADTYDDTNPPLFVHIAKDVWGLHNSIREIPFTPNGMAEPSPLGDKSRKMMYKKATRYRRSQSLPRLLRALHGDKCQITGEI